MIGCRYGNRVFARLAELRVPLIAALNGATLGGGLELAATADIRIAEDQARLGLPETGLGMVPGWSGTQRLVRRFGAQIVRRMALGGEMFDASQALTLGLVDQVVPRGTALSAATVYAARIAERGPASVQTTKLMLAAATGEVQRNRHRHDGFTTDRQDGRSARGRRGVQAASVRPSSRENGDECDDAPAGADGSQGRRLQDARSTGSAAGVEVQRRSTARAPRTASSSAAMRPQRAPMPTVPSPPHAGPSTRDHGRG